MKKSIPGCLAALASLSLVPTLRAAVSPEPVPFKVPARLADQAEALSPAAVYVGGFLGTRVEANADNRLAKVDLEPLLAGYRHKPGVHPWIGEHIGKWMHAATLAWANSNDATLRSKLDYAAAELIKAQEPDGYLGTYTPDKRFGLYPGADWDVWSHKYCLIGLLTYYQYTGNEAALAAARKAGDLLAATFPAKKSIIAAGTHVGMAATSVLEPMVLLYRFTGDARYLEFCRYIVQSWSEPNGPHILESLRAGKGVNETANGKAYEMLSNLVGLCELARATGDRDLLDPVIHAWEDVVRNRLYLTGSASAGEHFQKDHVLPNQPGADICETCVTTTWIQLNQQLLRLTGDARYGTELERSFYNHLAAAQRPDGAEWCYYTALDGPKPYGPGINCCVSSGPRGMALVVQQAYLKTHENGDDVLAVNLFEPSRVVVELGGRTVGVDHQSGFPRQGGSTFRFFMDAPARFGLKLRAAAWAGRVTFKLNDKAINAVTRQGWIELPVRQWRNADRLAVKYSIGPRLVAGDNGNQGREALLWGPIVLAYDQKRNPRLGAASGITIARRGQVRLSPLPGDDLLFAANVQTVKSSGSATATLSTFADAGADGGRVVVWLRQPGTAAPVSDSVLLEGTESRSREGNQSGSINDGDPGTFAVTFNAQPAAEDWFAVNLDSPARIARVAFAHGRGFHDGGWFDASAGKPRIQVLRPSEKEWTTVAELASYPATTATDPAGLAPGQRFAAELAAPIEVTAVRVIGKPACGDNPAQAFSSCGELEAFAK